jgi:hypothetical protein
MKNYDIIGDVHGHAGILETLLKKLGYANSSGYWSHPSRTAVFVGDLIDRGTENFKTLEIVKAMVDNGSALIVMGNHEYNALCFHTGDNNGRFLRPHIEKNIAQHEEVLKEIENRGPPGLREWHMYLEWFRRMPLFLELNGFRVVHACWDPQSIDFIKENSIRDTSGRLTDRFLSRSVINGSDAYNAVDTLLKGEEIPFPEGHPGFHDKDGNPRNRVRLQWWIPRHERQDLETYDQVSRVDRHVRQQLTGLEIPREILEEIRRKGPGRNSSPVFIGHYWFSGKPRLLTGTVASLDYSVGLGGPLVCYRWDGEPVLDPMKFVGADPDEVIT